MIFFRRSEGVFEISRCSRSRRVFSRSEGFSVVTRTARLTAAEPWHPELHCVATTLKRHNLTRSATPTGRAQLGGISMQSADECTLNLYEGERDFLEGKITCEMQVRCGHCGTSFVATERQPRRKMQQDIIHGSRVVDGLQARARELLAEHSTSLHGDAS